MYVYKLMQCFMCYCWTVLEGIEMYNPACASAELSLGAMTKTNNKQEPTCFENALEDSY